MIVQFAYSEKHVGIRDDASPILREAASEAGFPDMYYRRNYDMTPPGLYA
jgi:hypothetical protein